MTELRLRRIEQSRQTLGLLSLHKDGTRRWTCVTSEQPWRSNENNVSCIPPGPDDGMNEYPVEHRDPEGEWSSFPYPHFSVEDVPGRSAILIHRGNYVSDTRGCILVGRRFVDINADGVTDITHSTQALRELVDRVPDEGAILTVQWAYVPDVETLLKQDPDVELNDMIAEAELA